MVFVIIGLVVVIVVCLLLFLYRYMGMGDSRIISHPDEQRIRVACVGDSITYGCLVENRKNNNYPNRLGEMLGADYQVENFGLTNRTVCNYGDNPYRLDKVKEYQRSIDFNANIVIVMLGTNDAKDKNFKTIEDFLDEYKELVKPYLKEDVKVYFCTPASAYGLKQNGLYGYGIRNDNLIAIRDVISKYAFEQSIELIDIGEVTKNHKDMYSFDGIHPNAKGAELIANTIYNSIKESK